MIASLHLVDEAGACLPERGSVTAFGASAQCDVREVKTVAYEAHQQTLQSSVFAWGHPIHPPHLQMQMSQPEWRLAEVHTQIAPA
eukprot:CAMPEP_0185041580 /NCGR_PEP_ID=MMETSP1103-20130426/41075_1 /TAXON_ID=36769 /ORGANISM="Paraphysomonas bandaiensis, Strain Caron Lab Isolate" /LENGTH=84 /DNA_ID=CAMNT_0027581381 /DNA_START=212 /DNA_END=466 /DNA_ORIENTATION=+